MKAGLQNAEGKLKAVTENTLSITANMDILSPKGRTVSLTMGPTYRLLGKFSRHSEEISCMAFPKVDIASMIYIGRHRFLIY